MFQIFFSVAVASFSKQRFDTDPEANYLKGFDAARAAINSFAIKAYDRTKKNNYSFTVADFQLG